MITQRITTFSWLYSLVVLDGFSAGVVTQPAKPRRAPPVKLTDNTVRLQTGFDAAAAVTDSGAPANNFYLAN